MCRRAGEPVHAQGFGPGLLDVTAVYQRAVRPAGTAASAACDRRRRRAGRGRSAPGGGRGDERVSTLLARRTPALGSDPTALVSLTWVYSSPAGYEDSAPDARTTDAAGYMRREASASRATGSKVSRTAYTTVRLR